MIQAIRPIGQDYDSEFLRIAQELRKYGLQPSGNHQVDRGRLEKVKEEFVSDLQEKYDVGIPEYEENPVRTSMEEERPGAMAVAQLNRILLGI